MAASAQVSLSETSHASDARAQLLHMHCPTTQPASTFWPFPRTGLQTIPQCLAGVQATLLQQGVEQHQLVLTEVHENKDLRALATIELPKPLGAAAHYSRRRLVPGQACVTVASSTGLQCALSAQEAPKVASSLSWPISASDGNTNELRCDAAFLLSAA